MFRIGIIGEPRILTATLCSGTEGYIRIDNINCPESIEVWRNYELVQKIEKPEDMINGYEYQVIECKRCIKKGLIESPMMPHEETISIMNIIQ